MASEDPAFLFYPGDYLRDTQCLSEPAQVAYDRIMCEHMRNICISQAQLDFFTKRLTADQKSEVMMVLRPSDAGFCIPWVQESIIKRREYSESRRKNRSSKPKKEPESTKKTSSSYVPHMENENAIENGNGIKIKEESKNEILTDPWFDEIFDSMNMEGIRSTFPLHNIPNELAIFKLKARAAPKDYIHRDAGSIRQGFIYQLKNSKATNGNGNNTKAGTRRSDAIVGEKQYKSTWD